MRKPQLGSRQGESFFLFPGLALVWKESDSLLALLCQAGRVLRAGVAPSSQR